MWAIFITDILLLLSLPVLAGKLFILPALNLAIYWELLYVHKCIWQSIGKIWISDSYKFFRDYTPKYINYRNYSTQENLENYNSNKDISNSSFASYLTGLIEGDGTIVVPKNLWSPKSKLNYPSIQIVFHLKKKKIFL